MKGRCVWIILFCALTITAAVIVMSLYHTSLRFDDRQLPKTSMKPNLDNLAINTNTSECKDINDASFTIIHLFLTASSVAIAVLGEAVLLIVIRT